MFRPNLLKSRLQAGESVYGAWVGSGSPSNAELLGHIGFDFLVLDQEHGAGELSDAVAMLRAAESSDTPCIVRAPWNDPIWLKRALDAGVDSVMIPSVETAAAARAAVAACRYPPQGARGYAAGVVRASTFGLEPDYVARANDNLLIVLQIESAAAVEHALKAHPELGRLRLAVTRGGERVEGRSRGAGCPGGGRTPQGAGNRGSDASGGGERYLYKCINDTDEHNLKKFPRAGGTHRVKEGATEARKRKKFPGGQRQPAGRKREEWA